MQSPIHHLSDSGPRIPGNKGTEQILSTEKDLLQLQREPAWDHPQPQEVIFPWPERWLLHELKPYLPINSAPPRADNWYRALGGIKMLLPKIVPSATDSSGLQTTLVAQSGVHSHSICGCAPPGQCHLSWLEITALQQQLRRGTHLFCGFLKWQS